MLYGTGADDSIHPSSLDSITGVEQTMFHAGRITRRYAASPTVMVLELEVPSLSTFDPGQWLDFVVPPNQWVGGFSIASCPKKLPTIDIAVKRSSHPPAAWVHQHSAIDMPVEVRVGGSCILQDKAETRPAVFCAGGIGISPILGQYRELQSRRLFAKTKLPTDFLYSVPTQDELVFGDELLELVSKDTDGLDKLTLSLTKQSEWENLETEDHPNVEFKTGRLLQSFLDNAPIDAVFYLCGPPAMLDDSVDQLVKRGIASSDIQCERWW